MLFLLRAFSQSSVKANHGVNSGIRHCDWRIAWLTHVPYEEKKTVLNLLKQTLNVKYR